MHRTLAFCVLLDGFFGCYQSRILEGRTGQNTVLLQGNTFVPFPEE